MGDEEKKKGELDPSAGLAFLKDLTLQFIEHRQVIANWMNTIEAKADQDHALIQALDSLNDTMTGMSFMLSRWNYVFDAMVDVSKGDQDAEPPVEARTPTLEDITAALEKFDADAEAEAQKAEDEEKKSAEESKPKKEPLISSAPKPPPSVAKPKLPLPKVEPLNK